MVASGIWLSQDLREANKANLELGGGVLRIAKFDKVHDNVMSSKNGSEEVAHRGLQIPITPFC